MPTLEELYNLTSGKNVFIAGHWDADGVSSCALMYHILKEKAASVRTLSKGEAFMITPEDIPEDTDYVICTDIQPSAAIKQDVIYIDHHPIDNDETGTKAASIKQDCIMNLYDIEYQSTTMLIHDHFLHATDDPLLLFLVMLGYFGDAGKRENLCPKLVSKAQQVMPEMLVEKDAYGQRVWEIETHVSTINVGKRMHWHGKLPLEMLKNISHYKMMTQKRHPLAQELQRLRRQLGKLYSMKIDKQELPHIDYAMIQCEQNIQGVIAMRHMNQKPIMIMNRRKDTMIASMRAPDEHDFDCGSYLAKFMKHIPGALGGGHEKAGGTTFPAEHVDQFISLLHKEPNAL